eukprot:SAG11_NODE_2724_length_3043_cov_1.463315_2_plen_115_part_00
MLSSLRLLRCLGVTANSPLCIFAADDDEECSTVDLFRPHVIPMLIACVISVLTVIKFIFSNAHAASKAVRGPSTEEVLEPTAVRAILGGAPERPIRRRLCVHAMDGRDSAVAGF